MQDIQMDKNIYESRPQNEGSRLPKELAVYDLLTGFRFHTGVSIMNRS